MGGLVGVVTSRSNRQSRSANRSGSVAITDEERAQRTSSYKKKSDDNPNLEKKTMSEADMWSDKEMDANVSSKSIVKNTRLIYNPIQATSSTTTITTASL